MKIDVKSENSPTKKRSLRLILFNLLLLLIITLIKEIPDILIAIRKCADLNYNFCINLELLFRLWDNSLFQYIDVIANWIKLWF